MKKDDINIYREVQKNTEMAIKAIDTIANKVYDEELTRQLAKETVKYSELKNQALSQMVGAKVDAYQTNHMQNMMLVGGIHSKTFLDISTGHIAELMIQGSNRGITEMCKVINHNEAAEKESVELAKELMDFEEKNIEQLKRYL